MAPRLPWQRNPEGGYIAYPEGEEFPRRVAEIYYDATSATKWKWLVRWEDAVQSNHAHDKQLAANEATARWPIVKRDGIALAAVKAEAVKLQTDVRRVLDGEDVPLTAFGIESANSKKLTRIIDIVKAEGGLNGPAKSLVEACSAELFRRRTAQPIGTTTEGSGGPVRT
jgi:hypothetical protein